MQLYRRIDKSGNETWSETPPWWHAPASIVASAAIIIPLFVFALMPAAQWAGQYTGPWLRDSFGISKPEAPSVYDILTGQN